jgi:L-ascorbate metabolism protein UlaG (beta-lactamase superfamily)
MGWGVRWLGVAMVTLTAMAAPQVLEKDVLKTTAGDLEITMIGHGTLMFRLGGKVIHVDPYGKLADYATLDKADLVLITHGHGDHLDPAALAAIRSPKTQVVVAAICEGKVAGAETLRNGDTRSFQGFAISAVPAYNIVQKRPDGTPFHPKGEGNGYVLAFGDSKIYVAGDTENIPEMKALKGITAAFLPMNLPYTMTPEQVAEAVRAFRPKILYPYHFGDTDPARLVALLKDEPGIEVRIRRMK